MTILKRSDIRPPTLAKETIPVDELGGEVVVRGMTLTERLTLSQTETGTETYGSIAQSLAWCVLDADAEPMMSRDEWEAFGAQHIGKAIDLFMACKRLSGLAPEDIEKKSAGIPT